MITYRVSSGIVDSQFGSGSIDLATPPSSSDDAAEGYLEIEGLKYDSAKMMYISLLLGSLIAGAVTVSTIIKSNK